MCNLAHNFYTRRPEAIRQNPVGRRKAKEKNIRGNLKTTIQDPQPGKNCHDLSYVDDEICTSTAEGANTTKRIPSWVGVKLDTPFLNHLRLKGVQTSQSTLLPPIILQGFKNRHALVVLKYISLSYLCEKPRN